MDIVKDAVSRLEERMRGSGCEDGIVALGRNADRIICQFEKGVCMQAVFGGRSAEFVTMDPISATTRISYMSGAALEKNSQRSAACAILNVAAGFLCISRVLKACEQDSHPACLEALSQKVRGTSIFLVGVSPGAGRGSWNVVKDPEHADLLVFSGDGMISAEGTALVSAYTGKKRMLFLGPSPAGVCSLEGLEIWCPHGRG